MTKNPTEPAPIASGLDWPQTASLIAAILAVGGVLVLSHVRLQSQISAIRADMAADRAIAAADRRAFRAGMDEFRAAMLRLAEQGR